VGYGFAESGPRCHVAKSLPSALTPPLLSTLPVPRLGLPSCAATTIVLLSLNVACLVVYWLLYTFFIARAFNNLKHMVSLSDHQDRQARCASSVVHCIAGLPVGWAYALPNSVLGGCALPTR